MRAILIGFAGRAKQERVGRKPALFICALPAGPNRRDPDRVTELLCRIEEIVAPTVVGMGFELVRVALSKGGTLQIMVEPADGGPMDVEACATISRALSAVLDVEDPIPGNYTLEVSSPGIDRPLTRPKDYARWAGHVARLETAEPVAGRRRFKGTLLGLSDGLVSLRLDDSVRVRVTVSR